MFRPPPRAAAVPAMPPCARNLAEGCRFLAAVAQGQVQRVSENKPLGICRHGLPERTSLQGLEVRQTQQEIQTVNDATGGQAVDFKHPDQLEHGSHRGGEVLLDSHQLHRARMLSFVVTRLSLLVCRYPAAAAPAGWCPAQSWGGTVRRQLRVQTRGDRRHRLAGQLCPSRHLFLVAVPVWSNNDGPFWYIHNATLAAGAWPASARLMKRPQAPKKRFWRNDATALACSCSLRPGDAWAILAGACRASASKTAGMLLVAAIYGDTSVVLQGSSASNCCPVKPGRAQRTGTRDLVQE